MKANVALMLLEERLFRTLPERKKSSLFAGNNHENHSHNIISSSYFIVHKFYKTHWTTRRVYLFDIVN